jgi:hypothetical protein
MKNLRLLTLLLFLGSALSGCAQTSFIKRGAAFVSETAPGTEMVDDNGNPVAQKRIVNYIVYIEFSGEAPEWKYAWYNNEFFILQAAKINTKTFEVGINKTTGKKIILQQAKGNQLWQLDFIRSDNPMKVPIKKQKNEVILEGIRQNKKFHYRIPKVVALLTPDAV